MRWAMINVQALRPEVLYFRERTDRVSDNTPYCSSGRNMVYLIWADKFDVGNLLALQPQARSRTSSIRLARANDDIRRAEQKHIGDRVRRNIRRGRQNQEIELLGVGLQGLNLRPDHRFASTRNCPLRIRCAGLDAGSW